MNAILTLTSEDLDNDDIQTLTRELVNTINNESHQVSASLAESSEDSGLKGDPVTIGTIILTFIGAGGVAVKLVEVLKAYVERPRHLKIKVKNANGETIEIDSANLNSPQLDRITKTLKKMFGEQS